jgi:hypothetical protein
MKLIKILFIFKIFLETSFEWNEQSVDSVVVLFNW